MSRTCEKCGGGVFVHGVENGIDCPTDGRYYLRCCKCGHEVEREPAEPGGSTEVETPDAFAERLWHELYSDPDLNDWLRDVGPVIAARDRAVAAAALEEAAESMALELDWIAHRSTVQMLRARAARLRKGEG